MCLVALDISKEVRFAAVTDTNGKLIAGKQRKDGNINNSRIKTRLFQLSSAEAKEYRQHSLKASATFCHYDSNYLFYANYLASALKRIKNDMQCTVSKGQDPVHRIELVQIHGLLKIAITPLTARNDRYLCIYLESSSSDRKIITKILNAI